MVSDKGKELIRKLIEKLRGESPRSVKQTGSAIRVVQAAPVRSKVVKSAKKPAKAAKKKTAVKSKPKSVKKIVKKAEKKKPAKKAAKPIVKSKKKKR
ncbi:MAG: hypothetical protein V1492_02345 [Candidatus Micrarchaeota archaeon]